MVFPYILVVPSAVGGLNWTDIATAIGTIGAVLAAVGIALWSDRRSGRRDKEERARSDRLLAEQRALDKAAIEDERAHGRAQLEEERQLARDREQLTEAYKVQVVQAQRGTMEGGWASAYTDAPAPETSYMAVMIMNHGSYTITRVEAQFCLDGNSMIQHHKYERLPGLGNIPQDLWRGYGPAPDVSLRGVLTPFDTGIRFETDQIHRKHLNSPYPVVRWTDQWGTRWEHKRGIARPVGETDPFEP